MTHRKKLTIFLLAVATLFTFVLLIHPYRKNDSSLLSDKLLRFRVLADSDSSIDQYEKNELIFTSDQRLKRILVSDD